LETPHVVWWRIVLFGAVCSRLWQQKRRYCVDGAENRVHPESAADSSHGHNDRLVPTATAGL